MVVNLKKILLLIASFWVGSFSAFAESNLLEPKQDRVRELKEQVLDKKLQLQLVRSLIEREKLDTQYPKVQLQFVNKMSSRYLLQSIEYFVDDSKVFSFYNDINKLDKKEKANEVKIEDFQISLSPGLHNLKVIAIYTGNDTGVFSYLSDYKVRSEAVHSLDVRKGTNERISIVGFEKGNMFTDFKERPEIEITKN